MNINDVTETIAVPVNIWRAIFEKQWELAIKYKDIENMGDLLDTRERNIDTPKGQKWIKDFAWRVSEELAEGFEAVELLKEIKFGDTQSQIDLQEHFREELADALHFLVELTIIAGYDYEIAYGAQINEVQNRPWDVVYYMGLMCNTLKNKPWKQTAMLTDRAKFEMLLSKTWGSFKGLLKQRIGRDKDIYNYYFKKHKVNQFRQRSNY